MGPCIIQLEKNNWEKLRKYYLHKYFYTNLLCFFWDFTTSGYFLVVELIACYFFATLEVINPLSFASSFPQHLYVLLVVSEKEICKNTHFVQRHKFTIDTGSRAWVSTGAAGAWHLPKFLTSPLAPAVCNKWHPQFQIPNSSPGEGNADTLH